jgi:hypothetical protein
VIIGLTLLAINSVMAGDGWETTEFRIEFHESIDRENYPETKKSISEGIAQRERIRRAALEAEEELRYKTPDNKDELLAEGSTLEAQAILATFFEDSLREIAEILKNDGFLGPSLKLHLVDGSQVFKINVFDFSNSPIKYSPTASGLIESFCSEGAIPWLAVNAKQYVPLTPELEANLYDTLAHELFHLIQHNYDREFQSLRWCENNKGPPNVFLEGSATAVAHEITQRRFPQFYKSKSRTEHILTSDSGATSSNQKVEIDVSGIDSRKLGARRYSINFLDPSSIKDEKQRANNAYLSSSFWRLLIERFGIRTLDHLMRQNLRSTDLAGVTRWLDEGLKSYNEETRGLFTVYPHFISDFSSYPGSRIPAEDFYYSSDQTVLADQEDGQGLRARNEVLPAWMGVLMDGCEKVELNASENTEALFFISLDRISAKCLDLSWDDFEAPFDLRLEAEHDNPRIVDQLHLGLAYEKAQDREKHCHTFVKADYSEPLRTCMHEKPFIKEGPGNQGFIKDWGEVGVGLNGSGRRMYVITNVAKRAEKTLDITEDDPAMFRIGIIDATGKDGREYEPPNAGPTGTAAALTGPEALYGITRHPTGVSTRLSFSIPVKDSDLAYGAHWMGEPLPLGYAGPYRGAVSRPSSGNRAISSTFCPRHSNGVVGQIARFDRDHLWVDIDADLCEMTIPPPADGHFPKVDELKVSLRIPFGWRNSAENAAVDIVTPGMQIFIDRHAKRLPMILSGTWHNPGAASGMNQAGQGTSGSPGTAASSGAPGESGMSTGGAVCDCSCEAYSNMNERAEAVSATGDQDAIMKLSGQMMTCSSQCQQPYLICELEKNNQLREAELAARSSRDKAEAAACDCSCDALDQMERRGMELQARIKPGHPVPMEEIMKMSQCMNTCQSEFVTCRMN